MQFILLKCIKWFYVCCFLKWPRNIFFFLINHKKELGKNCLGFVAFSKQAVNPVVVTRGRGTVLEEKQSQGPSISSTASTGARSYFVVLEKMTTSSPTTYLLLSALWGRFLHGSCADRNTTAMLSWQSSFDSPIFYLLIKAQWVSDVSTDTPAPSEGWIRPQPLQVPMNTVSELT